MTTKDFIEKYAEAMEIPKRDADTYVLGMIDTLKELISNGEEVQFYTFGTFGSKVNPEHMAKNPRTKESVTVPEKTVPTFKYAGTFKKTVAE